MRRRGAHLRAMRGPLPRRGRVRPGNHVELDARVAAHPTLLHRARPAVHLDVNDGLGSSPPSPALNHPFELDAATIAHYGK